MTLEEMAITSLANTQVRMAQYRLEHRPLPPQVVVTHPPSNLRQLSQHHQFGAHQRALRGLPLLLAHLQALLQLQRHRKPVVISFALVQTLESWAL
jgi:hypothetical protein